MDYINSIIDSIEKVFKISDENISSLAEMLSDIDIEHLYNRFSTKKQMKKYRNSDLISKVDLLNALLEIVLESPNLELVKTADRKELIVNLCGIIASLYEQVLERINDNYWDSLPYLVMYSMLSYIADRQTMSDIIIKEYNKKLINTVNSYDNSLTIQKLGYDAYYLIVYMMSNIKNQEGLMQLNAFIDRANKDLEQAQNEELAREKVDISVGVKIVSYGNIIYLTTVLKDYLFKGIIDSIENQNIQSVIDAHTYNVLRLLTNEDIDLKLIGHFIKYSYGKVAENSVWNIAEKSPLIKRFIEKNLSTGERYIYTLLPSQRDVISEVLTPKKSVIVGMPTSAGKSFLAEMQILFSIHNYETEDYKPTICYVVPTNALIDQVKRDLQNDFKEFDYNIETALPYYDVDEIEDEILINKHIDILISTPEKLESLVRQNHPSIKNMRLVILDEAHNLGDVSRGSKFELVLSAIKQNVKEVNFLLLSPFIGNAAEISEWLADSPRNAANISIEWYPTKQYIGCVLLKNKKTMSAIQFFKSPRNQLVRENIEIDLRLNPKDIKSKLRKDRLDNTVRLCVILGRLIKQDGNILVLCGGKGTTVKLALEVMNFLKTNNMIKDVSTNEEIKRAIEIVKLENGDRDSLIECLKFGICYHNSGLSSLVKETIEELVRNNKIKIVFATTTLAQGMNFPINTVIFDTVKIRNKGNLTNAEFWNIAGRAGRAYQDKNGYVILSCSNSQKEIKNETEKYIKADLKEVVSSLNSFFTGDKTISLDYDVLRDSKNAPLLNLLQYINHILNISYDYNIDFNDTAKIRSILMDSFLYHSLIKQEGFINAQKKLELFVKQYIYHVNDSKKDDMIKADELGISDISYMKVKSIIRAFINNLKEKGDSEYKVSDIILHTKNVERLTEIISIIAKIPEIKIEMIRKGDLDAKSIAKLLLGWVNGDKVRDIAQSIKRERQSDEEVFSLCNQYLNGQMKSYMPWGINIYQSISYDMQTDNAQMLPSYIYYGVSNKEAVIVSKLGVPRFAIKNVLSVLKAKYMDVPISVEHMEQLKKIVLEFGATDYKVENVPGGIIKEIIDRRIK